MEDRNRIQNDFYFLPGPSDTKLHVRNVKNKLSRVKREFFCLRKTLDHWLVTLSLSFLKRRKSARCFFGCGLDAGYIAG